MTTKQQHKHYSCLILKGLRLSESVSLSNICAGTDDGITRTGFLFLYVALNALFVVWLFHFELILTRRRI